MCNGLAGVGGSARSRKGIIAVFPAARPHTPICLTCVHASPVNPQLGGWRNDANGGEGDSRKRVFDRSRPYCRRGEEGETGFARNRLATHVGPGPPCYPRCCVKSPISIALRATCLITSTPSNARTRTSMRPAICNGMVSLRQRSVT